MKNKFQKFSEIFEKILSENFRIDHEDDVAEWLRRWTANPMCSARVGSNPIVIEFLVGQLALTHYYLFWFLGEVCPISDHTICEDFILLRIQWFSLIIGLFFFVFLSLLKSIIVKKLSIQDWRTAVLQ